MESAQRANEMPLSPSSTGDNANARGRRRKTSGPDRRVDKSYSKPSEYSDEQESGHAGESGYGSGEDTYSFSFEDEEEQQMQLSSEDEDDQDDEEEEYNSFHTSSYQNGAEHSAESHKKTRYHATVRKDSSFRSSQEMSDTGRDPEVDRINKHAHDKERRPLNDRKLQEKVFRTLSKDGIIQKARALMREHVVRSLYQLGKHGSQVAAVENEKQNERVTEMTLLSDGLILEHLLHKYYSGAASVFEAEAVKGCTTLAENREAMRKLVQIPKEEDQASLSMLENVLFRIPTGFSGSKDTTKELKDSSENNKPISLADRLARVESKYVSQDSTNEDILQKMARYQAECDARAREEIDSQVAYIRQTELSRLRRELTAQFQEENEELRKRLQQEYKKKYDEQLENLERERSRLSQQRRDLEQEQYEARQKILLDLGKLRERENELKRSAELDSRALEWEKQKVHEMEHQIRSKADVNYRFLQEGMTTTSSENKTANAGEEVHNQKLLLEDEVKQLKVNNSALLKEKEKHEKSYERLEEELKQAKTELQKLTEEDYEKERKLEGKEKELLTIEPRLKREHEREKEQLRWELEQQRDSQIREWKNKCYRLSCTIDDLKAERQNLEYQASQAQRNEEAARREAKELNRLLETAKENLREPKWMKNRNEPKHTFAVSAINYRAPPAPSDPRQLLRHLNWQRPSSDSYNNSATSMPTSMTANAYTDFSRNQPPNHLKYDSTPSGASEHRVESEASDHMGVKHTMAASTVAPFSSPFPSRACISGGDSDSAYGMTNMPNDNVLQGSISARMTEETIPSKPSVSDVHSRNELSRSNISEEVPRVYPDARLQKRQEDETSRQAPMSIDVLDDRKYQSDSNFASGQPRTVLDSATVAVTQSRSQQEKERIVGTTTDSEAGGEKTNLATYDEKANAHNADAGTGARDVTRTVVEPVKPDTLSGDRAEQAQGKSIQKDTSASVSEFPTRQPLQPSLPQSRSDKTPAYQTADDEVSVQAHEGSTVENYETTDGSDHKNPRYISGEAPTSFVGSSNSTEVTAVTSISRADDQSSTLREDDASSSLSTGTTHSQAPETQATAVMTTEPDARVVEKGSMEEYQRRVRERMEKHHSPSLPVSSDLEVDDIQLDDDDDDEEEVIAGGSAAAYTGESDKEKSSTPLSESSSSEDSVEWF